LRAAGALINIECKSTIGRFMAVLAVVYFASPDSGGGFRGVFHVLVEDTLKRRKTVSVFSFQLLVKDEPKTEN
jgi:hypothetical protein